MGLNWAAIKMVKDNLFWGTGAGNFLVRLPFYQKEVGSYWLQPVHNIGLLILSEWGLLGGVWLGSMFRRWGKKYKDGGGRKVSSGGGISNRNDGSLLGDLTTK